MKACEILVALILMCALVKAQNVGINSTGVLPDSTAGLDVNFSNKGLLIPRVALTGSTDIITIKNPANSLLIYNTATAGIVPNDVTPGYYYYNGGWIRLNTGSASVSGWGTSGNSGITGSNFVGTTNAADLIFKANNTERLRIASAGSVLFNSTAQVGIGSSSFTAGDDAEKVLIDGGTGYNTPLNARGNINGYLQVIVQNQNTGNNASSDFVVANDAGVNYVDFGINSTGYSENKSNILNQINTPYLYASSPQWFYIGHGISGKGLVFFTNSGSTNTNNSADGFPRMQITSAGNVGIGNFVGSGADANNYLISEKLMVDGNVTPKSNGGGTLGSTALRWSSVFSQTSLNTSDRREKTNILPSPYGLKEILQLQPVTYNWIKNPNGDKQVGLIAQEVQKIIPEVVVGDESKETLSMNYNALIPVLINSIKQLTEKVEKQEAEMQALKESLTANLKPDKTIKAQRASENPTRPARRKRKLA